MASAGSLDSVSCIFCSRNSVSFWGWLCSLGLYTGRPFGSRDLGSLGYFLEFQVGCQQITIYPALIKFYVTKPHTFQSLLDTTRRHTKGIFQTGWSVRV